MTRTLLFALALALLPLSARAEPVDMMGIACETYLKFDAPGRFAAMHWFAGYDAAMNTETQLDRTVLSANGRALDAWCAAHPKSSVFAGINALKTGEPR